MKDSTERPPVQPSRGLRAKGVAKPPEQDRRWLLLVGAGALLLIVLGAAFLANRPASGEIAGLQTFENLTQAHQDGQLTYPQTPPVGGPHNAAWLNCGIYYEPVPNENAVHSLEHGAVWITYDPALPEEEVEALRNLVRGRTFSLLSPYEGLPAPIVASAWGVQIQAEEPSDPRLNQFLRTYIQGAQTPEPGAICTGALGVPDEN